MRERFWEVLPLEELEDDEWEALCDGCGQCCRMRFQDEDTEQLATSSVVCGLLDIETRRCTNYPVRHQLVPNCVELNTTNVSSFDWLPETCGYRRLAAGKSLEPWHPLISGSTETVETSGHSVTGQVISARDVHADDIAQHLLKWVDS